MGKSFGFASRVWREIASHKGRYVIAFLLVGLPVAVATIWPTLSHKTIPEWLLDRGLPKLTTVVFGWLCGVAIVGIVIIARVCLATRNPEPVEDKNDQPEPNIVCLGEGDLFVKIDQDGIFREVDYGEGNLRAIAPKFVNEPKMQK